jgi:glycosyltransferase involved in cell wall biosynthesis
MLTYGIESDPDLRAENIRWDEGRMRFTAVSRDGQFKPLEVLLNLPGVHYVLNALAVIAVAREVGAPDAAIAKGLAEFSGVGRRFQRYGDIPIAAGGRFTLVDDYGHHPAEMAATLAAARGAFPGRRVVLAFQPHRFTRTRDLFEDFVRVLSTADEVVLADVYPAGEAPIVVSVDRSDYAKGIAARLAAIRRLLERRAELRGRVVFVQVVSPSRLELPEFAAVAAEARHLTGEINRLYGDAAWQPVRLHAERVPHRQILALYRLADACVVSSLRDGMNLVAKEYVACRGGDDGCLILSRHTGAAERMPEALLVDPTDVGGFADTLADALAGLRDGRCSGLRELRARVLAENVHWWGGAIFARIAGLVQAKSRATKSRQ